MLEVLTDEPGKQSLVWMDITTMNRKVPTLPGFASGFTLVGAQRYRLRRPDANRAVPGARQENMKDVGIGIAAPPARGVHKDAWFVDEVKVTNVRHSETNLDEKIIHESKRPERNFIWLSYWPGHITYTPWVRGQAIVTGPMSGCYLVVFRTKLGRFLGHIGTDSNSAENTATVKSAWRKAVDSKLLTLEDAFKPQMKGGTTLGALSANGRNFYEVDLDTVDGRNKKVSGLNLRIGSTDMPF